MAYTLERDGMEKYWQWLRIQESIKRCNRSKPVYPNLCRPMPSIWGNQDLFYPISESAFKYEPTERIASLSVPKKDRRPARLIGRVNNGPGRHSMITPVTKGALKYEISERTTGLSKPRPRIDIHCNKRFNLTVGRPSLMTDVPPAALTCAERPHTTALAQPRLANPGFVKDFEYEDIEKVSYRSQIAHCSKRTLQMSKPRIIEMDMGRPRVARAINMERLEKLAAYRPVPEEHLVDKEDAELIAVSPVAQKAACSPRLKVLSVPITKSNKKDFRPNAFAVSPAALKGQASPRVAELATPIDRS